MTADVASRLRFEPDGTVTVLSGKVELGQGLRDALTMICSTELSLDPARIRVVCADTDLTPDEGVTAGSGSMEQSGAAVRAAAVAVRGELLSRAAVRLQVPESALEARAGAIRRRGGDASGGPGDGRGGGGEGDGRAEGGGGGPSDGRGEGGRSRRRDDALGDGRGGAIDYWDLLGTGKEAAPPAQPPGGTPRAHVAALVHAGNTFVHDLRLPGMVHGRVLRPPGYRYRLTHLAAGAARAMRGVLAVVVDGSFVGVIAEREEQAIAACDVLAAGARWHTDGDGRPPADGRATLARAPAETTRILDRGTPPAPDALATTLTATYSRPFLMHAALGPSAAAAQVDPTGRLTIWSHTQGPFPLRAALAEALNREPDSLRVIHVDGAGCYGHNGADDVALDAALLALQLPGRPVLVKWSRADENRWEPFGTAMMVTCTAALDTAGGIVSWRHEVRSHAHSTRPRSMPGYSTLLAAWHRRQPLSPPPARNGSQLTAGPQRNAEPPYRFPQVSLVTHFVPEAPVRVSALRSLGAYANVFATESFMDELAAHTGVDPVEFRLRHLQDERARQVLNQAVSAAPAAAGGAHRGRGVAVARYKNLQCYVAVVCDVAVDPGSGMIRLQHAALAADAGRIIDPDGLANQLEGSFLQAASWTLKEEVRWNSAGISSTSWDAYPVLRFSEVPPVTIHLLDRPELPSLGAGEAAQGPTPAAIANAVFAAAGVRLRDTPFTPARVMEALSRAARDS